MLDMNLNLYRIFYVVAQSKSYTDASNKLNITKPAISKYIKQLETNLNTSLFYRKNNGVRLTAEGNELFEFVEKSMTFIDAGEKLLIQKSDLASGEITIGTLSHIASFYLMDSIEDVKDDYQNLKIKIITAPSGKELINMLESHKIDFAIDSTQMEITNKEIQKEELKNIENIFISSKPIRIKELKELEEYNYILGLEYTTTSKKLLNVLKEHNINIHSNVEIDITELKIEAVKRNLGISYVMRDAVRNELANKEIFEVELPIALPTSTLNLIYLKGQLTKADKKFIKEYLKNNER